MTISKVAICNMALGELGAKEISSLTDGSTAAALCSRHYDQTVDEVLAMADWKCAMARKQLAASSETPDFEYDYQYPLPTNPYCLRVRAMCLDDGSELEADWTREGDMLLTNQDECYIKYIKRVTDPMKFEPLLVTAIYLQLAIKFAPKLQKDTADKGRLIEEFEKLVLPRAKYATAKEGYGPDQVKSTERWTHRS